MSSIERQDTFGSVDCYLSGGLLEAPTLSSKEIKHAREQALKILNTKSPEEAFKIFTEGSEAEAGHLLGEKVEAATMPPNTTDAKPNDAAVQPSPKN
ncbi:hypothetical protein PAHAL_7G176500 [Panicum hallii]|uniref:Uncharacterized protein n=1 Tax=Panicum hallii TaxID=206008 RepID=A0A2S3I7D2_9POAL|nr:uncharacterized protein LOC112900727 [Panicum hallii]PAN38498.1 hypothetical protein PAHAL_7G176500 [Panicum hallii]